VVLFFNDSNFLVRKCFFFVGLKLLAEATTISRNRRSRDFQLGMREITSISIAAMTRSPLASQLLASFLLIGSHFTCQWVIPNHF
jgi:hypothetical protein